MRALVAYAVAATIVVLVLAFNLNAAQHRIIALERQLAPAGRPNASDTARLGLHPNDADRAEAGYQRSKQLAADIVYSACRSQGGSRASCAKDASK